MLSLLAQHPALYFIVAICALLCFSFSTLFFLSLRGRPDYPILTAEWRGLGGGLGGLRVSTSFSFLCLTAFFGFLMAALVEQQFTAERDRQAEERKIATENEKENRRYEDLRQAREFELQKLKVSVTQPRPTGTRGGVSNPPSPN
jgi:hypothetical protein